MHTRSVLQHNPLQGGSVMKTLIGLVMFAMVLSVGMVPVLYAADVPE